VGNTYIEIKNVSRAIKNNLVLDNINLNIEKGKIYGFRGKNGSGKTMLFRAISGLINIDEGEIIIDNKVLGKDISFPESLGVLIEYPGFLPNLSGFKNLKYLADIKKIVSNDDIEMAIKNVGLDPKDNKKTINNPDHLKIYDSIKKVPNVKTVDFSSKEAQLKELTKALGNEPTNALDIDGVKLINDIILDLKKQGKTILIANHDKEELENVADEILLIDRGRIIKNESIGDSDK